MVQKTAAASTSTNPDAGAGATALEPTSTSSGDESTLNATDVSTLGSTLLNEQPDVQEHAVAQARAEAQAQIGADVNGEHFNAAIHAANADGSPRKTQGGAWAKKRGNGAKKGATATGAAKVVIPGGAGVTQAQLNKEQLARKGGAGAANLALMLGIGIGGDEWQPRKDDRIGLDEKAMLEQVFGDYFVAKDWPDLPPGWALVAGLGMYALPRFGMPKTRSRMQRAKDWIGAKIVQWRAHRAGLKVKVTSQQMDDRERVKEGVNK